MPTYNEILIEKTNLLCGVLFFRLHTVATTLKRKYVYVRSLKTYKLSQTTILLTSDKLNQRSFSRASILTRYFFVWSEIRRGDRFESKGKKHEFS